MESILQVVKQNILNANNSAESFVKQSTVALSAIDWSQKSLWISIFAILMSPLYWNLVARNEYRNRTLTKLFGSKETACSIFSSSIFISSLYRDYLFDCAIKDQPHGPEAFPLLATPEAIAFSYIIATCGAFFVGFSMKALGIHGTYMGDYFGIFMKQRVTEFPFNCVEHPMYYGSTMLFLGSAIWKCSPVGMLLSAWVLAVYFIAGIGFEQSFTNQIYSNLAKSKKAK